MDKPLHRNAGGNPHRSATPNAHERGDRVGEAYASGGQWDKAAPWFDRYFVRGRGYWESFDKIAGLPLYRNDPATYRRYAHLMLKRCGQSPDVDVVASALYWCLLIGENDADPQVLLQMAERCLKSRGNQSSSRLTIDIVELKGIAEYRAGRMTAAVHWLSKSREKQHDYYRHFGSHFFLSMAYQRLGNAEKAKTTYQQALRDLETVYGSRDRYQPGRGSWDAWIRCQVLRREAEAVLKDGASGGKPKD